MKADGGWYDSFNISLAPPLSFTSLLPPSLISFYLPILPCFFTSSLLSSSLFLLCCPLTLCLSVRPSLPPGDITTAEERKRKKHGGWLFIHSYKPFLFLLPDFFFFQMRHSGCLLLPLLLFPLHILLHPPHHFRSDVCAFPSVACELMRRWQEANGNFKRSVNVLMSVAGCVLFSLRDPVPQNV